jgi:hypothetical protein
MAGVESSDRSPQPRSETRELCEAVARQLQATEGTWTLELIVSDGQLRKVRRHAEHGASDLTRFDLAASATA